MLYPRRCPICEKIVLPKEKIICDDCYESLQVIHEPRCKKCSKPITSQESEYCFDCLHHKHTYDRGFALWVYDKNMRRSIASFKYKNKKEYADFYIQELLLRYQNQLELLHIDAIIPVPIHAKRMKQRGFNQACLLAEGISGKIGVPVYRDIVIRSKDTKPQKGLNDKERIRNVRDAFQLNQRYCCNNALKRVLLVDDIYTTGSTINACALLLKSMGIEQVYFISLCIGKGY